MSQLRNRTLLSTVALLAMVVGFWAFNQMNKQQPAFEGYVALSKDFTLTSNKGPVSLSDFKGKAVAIFFGYRSCPDVCPTSLLTMANAIKALPEDQQKRAHGLFITIDPERDTAENMAEYSTHFHPQITGLTGSADEIQKVAGQFYVVYNKVEVPGSEAEYSMDHSSTIYVVGPDGIVKEMVPHSDSPDNLIAALKTVLSI